jgi:hypothetical protein
MHPGEDTASFGSRLHNSRFAPMLSGPAGDPIFPRAVGPVDSAALMQGLADCCVYQLRAHEVYNQGVRGARVCAHIADYNGTSSVLPSEPWTSDLFRGAVPYPMWLLEVDKLPTKLTSLGKTPARKEIYPH